MRRRTKRAAFFVSLAVLAGACLVAAYMARLDAQTAVYADAEPAGYDLSIGTQKDMTALSWAYMGKTVNLARDAQGRWMNADDPACPVSNTAAGALARAAAAVTASMAVEGVTEFSQYGLDSPALTVMAAAGDTIVRYEVGNISITGEYYLRVDGGDTVYMENGGLAAAFQTELNALLDTESLPGDIALVTGLSVKTDAGSYALTRAPNGVWRREDGAALEEGPVMALVGLVLETDFSDCVSWDAGEDFGFDAPQGSAAVSYTDEDGKPGSFTLEYGDYDGRAVYVRFAGSGLVYRTSAAALDALMYPDWDAILPLSVMEIDPAAAEAFHFTLDGEEYEVLRLTEGEEVIYSASGWVLDSRRVEAWLQALSGLAAEGTASVKEGRGELFSLTVSWADEDAEVSEVSLWLYDSARALCVTEGESLLVPKEDALALKEELAELLTGE